MKDKPFTDMLAYEAGYRAGYDNALAEQPFDRAATIEECARVAETASRTSCRETIAAAIRALKPRKLSNL